MRVDVTERLRATSKPLAGAHQEATRANLDASEINVAARVAVNNASPNSVCPSAESGLNCSFRHLLLEVE
jgi:hypothetical protein